MLELLEGAVGAASREAVAGKKVPAAAATAGGAVGVALAEPPTGAMLGAAVGGEGGGRPIWPAVAVAAL